MSIVLSDLNEWPSLAVTVEGGRRGNFQAGGNTESETPENDWELLEAPENDLRLQQNKVCFVRHSSSRIYSNSTNINLKSLRHCSSSPDLRSFVLDESDDDDSSDVQPRQADDAESVSFSLVSAPASVISMSSGLTFRDAMLASKAASSAAPPSIQPRQKPRKQRHKPRFVVKPIKRSFKSTGDLKSLSVCQEEVGSGGYGNDFSITEDAIVGETDAMEFYQQKAAGYRGRINGSKLRPDEAKRRQIIMNKKEMQRQSQG